MFRLPRAYLFSGQWRAGFPVLRLRPVNQAGAFCPPAFASSRVNASGRPYTCTYPRSRSIDAAAAAGARIHATGGELN
jgi:hypothetical protein